MPQAVEHGGVRDRKRMLVRDSHVANLGAASALCRINRGGELDGGSEPELSLGAARDAALRRDERFT